MASGLWRMLGMGGHSDDGVSSSSSSSSAAAAASGKGKRATAAPPSTPPRTTGARRGGSAAGMAPITPPTLAEARKTSASSASILRTADVLLRNPNVNPVLLTELATLAGYLPSGVVAVPASPDLLEWQGVLFPSVGYFAEGALCFRLSCPLSYPEEAPSVFMSAPIPDHPLVDASTGEVELALAWHLPDQRLLGNVLLALKKLFLSTLDVAKLQAREFVPNEGALRRLAEDRITFEDAAEEYARQSRVRLVASSPEGDAEGGMLRFSELAPEMEAKLRTAMLSVPLPPDGATPEEESRATDMRAHAMTQVVLDDYFDPADGI